MKLRIFGLAVLFASSGLPAHAAVILAPAAGTIVTPGQTIAVKVGPSPGEVLQEVAFVTSDGMMKAPAGEFEANVRIPRDAVGPELLVAWARLANDGIRVMVVELVADPGPLVELMVAPPPRLGSIGQIEQLDVTGRFADGVIRDLTHSERGTTYQTSDAAILGVHPTGMVQARSRGTAQVAVRSHGKTKILTFRVQVTSPADNRIPVPNAGPDQTAAAETVVALTGAASQDPDGDPIRYQWQQETGPTVLLRSGDTVAPVFVAPRVAREETLEFSLVVVDSKEAMSFPAVVRITVRP
jgi:hypothetical protein